jgi:hypothetical protein
MFESDRMADIFARLGEPVFLARQVERNGSQEITLHTMDRKSAARLNARVREALRREDASVNCRVVAHNPRALRRVRSLESLARRFGEGRVVYDPTGFVARSEAVTDCARRLREALGDAVQSVLLDTSRRTLYVIVPESAVADRAEIVQRAGALMSEWQRSVDPSFALAVRIGVEPPRGLRLVSVDTLSVTQTIRRQVFERKGWLKGAIAVGAAALFGAVVTVPAAADPAVSKTNGSIFVRGGAYDTIGDDSQGEGEIIGKVTFPIGQQFGGQAEAAVGTEEYYGFGGHIFWRDPSWAMAGLFASYDDSNGIELTRYGAEVDIYLGQFTAGGRIGQQEGDVGDGTFGSVDVSFYVIPNLALRGGVEFEPDDGRDTVGRVGFEWQPAMDSSPGLSVFADGEWGDDYDHIRAGLKIHFGTDGMSLIDRERKADPAIVTGNRRDYGSTYTPPD